MWLYLYNHPSKLKLYDNNVKNEKSPGAILSRYFDDLNGSIAYNTYLSGRLKCDYSKYYLVEYADMRQNVLERIRNGETELNQFKKVWEVIFPEGRDTI